MNLRSIGLLSGVVLMLGASLPAHAQFTVTTQFLDTGTATGNAGGGGNAGQIENIDEGEALLDGTSGFPSRKTGTGSAATINFNQNFPGEAGDESDFAMNATGYVDVVNGTSGVFNLYVNSDDGFRLRKNGAVIGEFAAPTGNSNTTISNVSLSDGDLLRLTFFERAGGDNIVFKVNDANGAFVGDAGSGISITTSPVPEPASISVVGLVGAGILARRRRA